ncbi:hypothetical protein C4D60_Mb00t10340 [Musa balbisiana]|uniref:Uncharacterized protein n=1 Tax=Musa balbisiana TaxID=52838 RepID=A0A4S8I3B2_MUSBA|nr:hypothetical protein C4D60_Mb00t10340 [Musa balbisiana]
MNSKVKPDFSNKLYSEAGYDSEVRKVPSFNIMIGSTRPDPKFNLILGSTRSGPIVSQYPIENVHCCSSGNTWFHSTTSTRSCLFSAS